MVIRLPNWTPVRATYFLTKNDASPVAYGGQERLAMSVVENLIASTEVGLRGSVHPARIALTCFGWGPAVYPPA